MIPGYALILVKKWGKTVKGKKTGGMGPAGYVVDPDGVDVEAGAGGGCGGGDEAGGEAGSGRGAARFLRPPTERDRKKALGRGGAGAGSCRAERLRMAAAEGRSPLRRTARPLPGMTQVKTTPILARRLTQRGMRARATRRRHAASQKWLQFLERRS